MGNEPSDLRWRLATEEDAARSQLTLFDEGPPQWRAGHGEFRGLEFLEVRAKRIINEVPAASRMPFRYTINAYRGCSHACAYCVLGETPVLMADARTKPIAEVRRGDRIYGTVRRGSYRRYVVTEVLDQWSTVKRAYRIVLEDGTELVASADHRFLTERGWKHVIGAEFGPLQRPFLTVNNRLIGTGRFGAPPKDSADYRLGYLCGMIRGDGSLGRYATARGGFVHTFRLALTDVEALQRTKHYLDELGVPTADFRFSEASATRKELLAIRNQSQAGFGAITQVIRWPRQPSQDWHKGFLAGIFDAEGSYHSGALRICNKDQRILDAIAEGLQACDLPFVVEPPRPNGCVSLRVIGGLPAQLRFFHTVDPAITRKRTIAGRALKCSTARLRVVAIEPLGLDLPLYDITTGTGDFIANGVVSHNCFARPTHEYLNLNAGEDFERRIVVKINAVQRARAEVMSARWAGETIAMGTNTDPYQRCEGKYRLTRGIVEVLSEARNPFSILTKSPLILRDLDVLSEAARRTEVRAALSIGTLDEGVWKASEPGTPHPRRRVEAVGKLNAAGIPTSVLVAPILPGLSDSEEQIRAVVDACNDAGAVSVTPIALHLRRGVREVFMPWLESYRPDLVELYESLFPKAYAPKAYQDQVRSRAFSH